MKQIYFKSDPAYANRFEVTPDGRRGKQKPSRHFEENFKQSIYPRRGLTKAEIAALPKGITVVESKVFNLD